MKLKKSILIFGIFVFSIFFTNCDLISSVVNNSDDSEADDEDTTYVKNLGSQTTIALEGVKGKQLYYVNFNKGSSSLFSDGIISSSSTRYLTNATGVSSNSNIASYAKSENSSRNLNANIKHFIPPQTFSANIKKLSSRAATTSSTNYTEKAKAFEIGKTTTFYCDNDVNLNSYASKKVTLAAKGKNSSDEIICLVWVDSTLYDEDGTGSGETINQSMAEDIASKFALHYAHERSIFGEEFEYLIDSNGYALSSAMDYYSPTGNLVNIVIYDIGNDYKKSSADTSNSNSKNECGVAGYFYAKDYYQQDDSSSSVIKYSNEGKFFYVDAAFCNYSGLNFDSTATLYDGVNSGNSVSDTIISTLFHEFQHMIDFAQKNVKGVDVETWYNEMLSMLAEDMMAEQLGLTDSEAPWGARFPLFNEYYYYSGIDEYRDNSSDYSVFSYSTAYTFGAWLTREYGGPKLVSLISKNQESGMDSIKSAIEELTGESLSSRQLFKRFIQSVVFYDDFAKTNNLYTLNKDAGNDITTDGFTSTMKAHSLFEDDYKYAISTQSSNSTYVKGPLILSNGYTVDLRPHGFIIHNIGVATSDTVTLTFSRQQSENEQVMIYIQDDYSNIVE